MKFHKKLMLWGALGGALYFLLSYHFIFDGLHVALLKKSKLSLNYTFYSIQGKNIRKILDVDDLREDGIADLLVDMGKISEKQKEIYLARYYEEEEEY
ncbi:MAG: hypothetical protein JRH08_05250 [Deltaproteobacteria bacterium]|nr:hypothetical protein [Deltaproteobacteria bacterium]MBW2025069.1 hypothetical protein [Deltaproteobacteria bacterium]MBW2125103.1 hypothetical protein [Deltaproteobacteria bacterium]